MDFKRELLDLFVSNGFIKLSKEWCEAKLKINRFHKDYSTFSSAHHLIFNTMFAHPEELCAFDLHSAYISNIIIAEVEYRTYAILYYNEVLFMAEVAMPTKAAQSLSKDKVRFFTN